MNRVRASSSSTQSGPGKMSIRAVEMNSPIAKRSVSPGRNGKNRPHSTNRMTRLTQKKASPKRSSHQPGSIQSMPSSIGVISASAPTA